MFTLDTNILVYYAAGDPRVGEFLEAHRDRTFFVPSIVVVELLSYKLMDEETAAKFKNFLAQTNLVSLDLFIAEQAAELKRKVGLKLADAVIASSALATNSVLVTRNVRDFKKVKGLAILSP